MIMASAVTAAPRGGTRRVVGVRAIILVVALLAGCEPTTPPPGAGSVPSSADTSADASAPALGTSVVSVSGTTVQIVGTGSGTTGEFDLAAGSAEMTVSTCASNQVIPFVTLYDEKDNKLGLIVDAVYQVRNLAGGKYYLTVAANPDCVWTIDLTPK